MKPSRQLRCRLAGTNSGSLTKTRPSMPGPPSPSPPWLDAWPSGCGWDGQRNPALKPNFTAPAHPPDCLRTPLPRDRTGALRIFILAAARNLLYI